MDDEADPVVARLGRADLCRLHEDDALRRMAGRQRIHDLAHVGRARRAIAPRFGRGATRQPAMLIRPFRHRQVRIGRQPAAPGAQDVLGAVEVRQIVIVTGRSRPDLGEFVEVGADMGFQGPSASRPARRPSSAAISAATRAGQFTQASRSSRASRNTSATARARSTSSPFSFCEPDPPLLRLQHLVGGLRLQEGRAAADGRDRQPLFAQRVADGSDAPPRAPASASARAASGSSTGRSSPPGAHRWRPR